MNKSAEETILLTNKDPDPGSMFQDMMKGNNNNSITNGNDSKSASMNVFTGLNAMAGGMNHKTYSIIFDPGEQASLITFYVFIMILGLLFNAAIIWVIVARPNNRNPRNMYIVNLAISGIVMCVFCVPPTMLQILYGGWWHLGVFSCKLVPAIQGANILVSTFTITVIAIDRWLSVSNTNPIDTLSYSRVGIVIASVWSVSFFVMTPLLIYQDVDRMVLPGTDIVFMQVCSEKFPDPLYKHAFTVVILIVQYVMPLIVLPIVHAKILIFLRKNSGFQNDARRKEREMKRNRRMTMVLSCIGVIFAVSWLPYHLYLILTDIFILFQDDHKMFYLVLGLCHCVAMTSTFTNPLMYGWFNTSLRSELETLLPKFCRDCLHRRRNVNPKNAAQNGQHQDGRRRSNLNSTTGAAGQELKGLVKDSSPDQPPEVPTTSTNLTVPAKKSPIVPLIPRREQQELSTPVQIVDPNKNNTTCKNWV